MTEESKELIDHLRNVVNSDMRETFVISSGVLKFLIVQIDKLLAERDALQAKLDAVPMFNPDWSMAPDWAQWWAVDADGDEYWYADKPDLDNVLWIANGICEYIVPPDRKPAWRESLRYRPVTEVTR